MTIRLRAALLAGALFTTGGGVLAQPVTLDEAVRRATETAPALSAREAGIAAARANRDQAAVRPNPSVTVEGENLVGTGPYDVLRQSELTVTYSQPIERGGKRDARVALAERSIGVSEAAMRVTRLDLAAAVQRAYIDAQIGNEVVRIAAYRLRVEQETQREALRRVRGYKDPLFVETRAAARVAQAELGLNEAIARQTKARVLLASYWGGTGEAVEVEAGIAFTGRSDDLAAADQDLRTAEIDRARAAVVVEQTRSKQDYAVNGGARYLRGTGDVAVVAGVTIPLGRFDRNQGNIARAQAERQQLEFMAEADRLDRLRRLAALGAEADAARARAEGLMSQVFPKTTKTLDQVRWGYNRGGFNFRDVQDAADAILEVQDQWVDAMTRYRDLQSEIDRLTGRFDAPQPVETMP